MKAVRRWLIYRRLVNELAVVPAGSLAELGAWRAAINDFAWQCALDEVQRTPRPRSDAGRTSNYQRQST
jgi:hypothetical protein